MARGNSNFTLYTQVQFDNGQAVKATKELRNVLKGLSEDQKKAKQLLEDMKNGTVSATAAEIKAQQNVVKALNAKVAAQKKAVQASAQDLSMLRRAVTDLDKMSLRQLTMALKEAEKKMNSLGGSKRSQKELQATREIMDLIQTRITGIKTGFKDLWAAATNGTKMSATEMQNLIKVIEQNGTTLAKNKQHYQQMLNVVQQMRVKLANFKGFGLVDDAFAKGKASNILTPKLQEYIKFYQEIATSSKSSARQIEDANRKIAQAQEELNKRITVALKEYDGNALVKQVNKGLFRGTIGETKEAIAGLERFKESLRTTNPGAIKGVDDAINRLKTDLESTSRQAQMVKEYITSMGSGGGTFKATITNLELVKQGLVQMRSRIDILKNPDGIKALDNAIMKVNNDIRTAGIDAARLQTIINNPKAVFSLHELQAAYDKLKNEINKAGISETEFIKKASQMRGLDTQIRSLNKQFREQTETIDKNKGLMASLATNIKNIVLHYVGLQMILMRIFAMFKSNVHLSDEMTNVAKVTGMTASEVENLTKSIYKLDTREANDKLMELAEQAGKLGINTREGVRGMTAFVEVGQKITNTLGDIGGAEAITELLKVNDVVRKSDEGYQSLEESLNRIGSAVLNVGNNSKASYSGVVEFTKRLGPAASTIDLTMQQVMGLGGAFSSLGTDAAVASTATQRVLLGIKNNIEGVAKALNMDTGVLQQLLMPRSEGGNPMEALIMVLERLGDEGASGMDKFLKVLGGRYNQQARSALMLLSQHIGEVQYQVSLANKGYEDGTLVEQEYEKANNNLAGVLARIGNEFQEMFTAVSQVNGTFTKLAKGVLWVVQGLRSSGIAAGLAIATFFNLVLAIKAYTVEAYKSAIATATAEGAFKGFKGTLTGFATMVLYPLQMAWALVRRNTTLATNATKAFSTACKSNAIGLIITAFSILASIVSSVRNKMNEANDSLREIKNSANDQVTALRNLRDQLMSTNLEQKHRQDLITDFNSKAGQYLDNLIKERDLATQIAAAYNKAAAAIKLKEAESIREEGRKQAKEATKESREEAREDLQGAIGNMSRKQMRKNALYGQNEVSNQKLATDIESSINSFFDSSVAENKKTLAGALAYIKKQFGDRLNIEYNGQGANSNKVYTKNLLTKTGNYDDFYRAVTDLINSKIKERTLQKPYETEARVSEADAVTKQLHEMGNLRATIEKILKEQGQDFNTMGFSNVRTLHEDITRYLELQKQLKNEPRNKYGAQYSGKYASMLPDIISRIKPWGTPNVNTDDMVADELAEIIKFFDEVKNTRPGKKIEFGRTHIVPTGIELPKGIDQWSQQNIIDWAYAQWQYFSKQQWEKNHSNREGHFTTKNESNRSKTEKEDMDEARKHLEEYYKHREEVATNALNRGEVMESEYNRFILANQQELLINQAILEEKFIDSKKKFTTQAVNEWMKSITGVDGVVHNINYDKIEAYLADKGKHLVGTIQFNAEKYRASLTASIKKNREEIEKILLEDRPIAKLAESFLNDLNRLNLLFTEWNGAELMTTEQAQQKTASRLQFLMDEAKKGYALSTKQFIEDMKKANNGEFAPWAEALLGDKDQLQALLMLVQGFMDQYEEAVRKMENNMKKRFDQQLKTVGPDGSSFNSRAESITVADKEQSQYIARRQKSQSQADSWGFTGHNLAGVGDTDKYNINALDQQTSATAHLYEIELARYELMKQTHAEEISMLEERAKSTQDASMRAELEQEIAAKKQAAMNEERLQSDVLAESWRNVEQAQREATEGHLELLSNAINQAMPYYENLEQFAQDFGANIFGSKKDRQEAARDLMRNLIQTTGKMLTQWLVYISTKKIYDKMEVAMETMKQQQLLAIKLKAQAEMLAAEGKTEMADATMKEAGMAVDAAAAAGKEAAKGGWIGWALSTALTLAMTLAMSLAMSKLKKAIPNSASAGKLTTGMLTYAEGRYPVFADGMMNGTRQNVMGTDGRRYNAVVKPNLTTGEYARPHLGIVGERGAELIVDHPTYQRLKEQEPWVLRAIYNTKRFGSSMMDYRAISQAAEDMRYMDIKRFRTHAEGSVDALAEYGTEVDTSGTVAGGQEQMMQILANLTVAVQTLQEQGVRGHFDRRELVDTYDSEKKEMRRMGV